MTIRRVAVASAALAALALLPACSDDDDSGVGTEGTVTTSTTVASTTTTARVAELDADTPLSSIGVGPIEAGRTLREIEADSGLSFTVDGLDMNEGACFYAHLDEQPDLIITVFGEGGGADPLDATVASVSISGSPAPGDPVSTRTTNAGIGLGATEAEVRAAHPGAIDEEPHFYVPEGAYLYVRPEADPGFGIRYVLDEDRTVTMIDVGTREAIRLVEGCA